MLETVGDRLHHVRTVAELRQKELARLAGLKSPRHIGLIEEGERDNVTAQTATGLCEVLGMTLDWFLLGKGDPPSDEAVRAAVAEAQRRNPKPASADADEDEDDPTEDTETRAKAAVSRTGAAE